MNANPVKENGELLSNAHVTETQTGTEDMSLDLNVQMSELQTQFQELTASYEGVVAKLATAEDLVKELQTEKSENELTQRTEKRQAQLEVALGKENNSVATLLASTATLSDEHFNDVIQGLASSQEDTQKELKEIGGEGQEAVVQLDLSQQLKQMAASMNTNRKA